MGHGERQGARESIDRLTVAAVERGADLRWAKRKAREAAIRYDERKDRGE